MRRRTGYLFITSPASTTPMHFDPEHSFLLQVRGVKNVSVAAFDDDLDPPARARSLLDGVDCDFAAMQEVAEDLPARPRRRGLPPVVRAALGRDGGRRLRVLLDPVCTRTTASAPTASTA